MQVEKEGLKKIKATIQQSVEDERIDRFSKGLLNNTGKTTMLPSVVD